jgi:hypothetical protein
VCVASCKSSTKATIKSQTFFPTSSTPYTTDCKPPPQRTPPSSSLVSFLFARCNIHLLSLQVMSCPSGSNGAAKLKRLLSLPGNRRCADCGAPGTPPPVRSFSLSFSSDQISPTSGPQWASLTFGSIFCIRCSGVHRWAAPPPPHAHFILKELVCFFLTCERHQIAGHDGVARAVSGARQLDPGPGQGVHRSSPALLAFFALRSPRTRTRARALTPHTEPQDPR